MSCLLNQSQGDLMSSTVLPIDTYRIDLPDSWRQVPLESLQLKAFLAANPEQLAKLEASTRRRLEWFVDRMASDLQSTNTNFLALFAEVVEITPDDNEAAVDSKYDAMIASCSIATLTREEMGSPLQLLPEAVLEAMSVTDNESDAFANLEPPEIVVLPAGRAVRLTRLIGNHAIEGSNQVFAESFLLCIGPDFETIVALQFATINLEEASVFSELFFTLANTFKIYREGDPTVKEVNLENGSSIVESGNSLPAQ
jgi:hypothetical protein